MATYTLNPDTGLYVLSADQSFSVTTDQPDYLPGSTASFTANVVVGDTVTFDVIDVAGTAVTDTNTPWTVTDGGAGDRDGVANGVIQTTWAVGQDAAGEAFVLSATDQAAGLMATASFTDSPPEPAAFAYIDPHIDLAAASGLTKPTGDLILANAGSALVAQATSGTGNFGTFVEVQARPTESGFNTTNNTVLDGKNSDQFNTAVKISDLQAVHADGSAAATLGSDTYYEFKLDLHQANSKPYISLDSLQFWESATANLGPGTFVSGTNPDGSPSFHFDAGQASLAYDPGETSILLNSLFTSGSGGGTDLVVLVKTADFAAVSDYLYLYSAFGYQGGDWSANSTFEEWGALMKTGGGPPPPTPHATLSVDKETFCDSPTDAHNLKGGVVLAGSDIVWTYRVTATNDAVSGLVLTDDAGTPNVTTDDVHPMAVLGNGSTTADALHNIGDLNNDTILDVGETWSFIQTGGIAAVGVYNNEVIADGTSVKDGTAAGEGLDTSGYFGANPLIHITKVTNGLPNPVLKAGDAITWTYTVTNTGNVALGNIVITDDNGTVPTSDDLYPTLQPADLAHHTGDENGNGVLDLNETWIFTAAGTAEKLAYTNHVVVEGTTDIGGVVVATDVCGDLLSASASASSGYTGAQTLAGLTKGFWATHLTLWDVTKADDATGSPDLNLTPKLDWDKSGGLSFTTDTVNLAGKGSAAGSVTGSGDSGLLLGDLNHDGGPAGGASDGTPHGPHDANALFFDLASAQALLNSSVTGDARIIMAGQALAAQLNEYNDFVYDNAHGTGLAAGFEASPNGLIEAATAWLSGVTDTIDFGIPTDASNVVAKKGVATSSSVDSNTANDVSGTKTVISEGLGADYKITSGAFAFTDGTSAGTVTALSSSSNAWNKFVDVFSYHPGTDSSGSAIISNYTEVSADGEGLKNALAAYNHGLSGTTGGFVVSADGSQIGWQDTLGGAVYDIHDNTVGAFWGILEDQNVLHSNSIVGVAAHA